MKTEQEIKYEEIAKEKCPFAPNTWQEGYGIWEWGFAKGAMWKGEEFQHISDWEKVRIQAAIAAMPIANNIVDNLYSADYHGTEVSKLHSIEKFTQECVAIADALIEELKKEKIDI